MYNFQRTVAHSWRTLCLKQSVTVRLGGVQGEDFTAVVHGMNWQAEMKCHESVKVR